WAQTSRRWTGWQTSLFFSSRRRHTSFSRDWSSDVCSSDLSAFSVNGSVVFPGAQAAILHWLKRKEPESLEKSRWALYCKDWLHQIGRASGRERGQRAEVAGLAHRHTRTRARGRGRHAEAEK